MALCSYYQQLVQKRKDVTHEHDNIVSVSCLVNKESKLIKCEQSEAE
jgi:hypothetical protein